MPSDRKLLCQFNRTNELVKHEWQVHQTLEDDTKIETCLDRGQWVCTTQEDGVFGSFDFHSLFATTKMMLGTNAEWKFYRNLIPYTPIHYHKYNKQTGASEHIQRRNDTNFDATKDEYLILNLSDYSFYFESHLFLQMRLESIYQRFLEKIQTNYFKFLCFRFMPQQERMLTQVATTLANRNGYL